MIISNKIAFRHEGQTPIHKIQTQFKAADKLSFALATQSEILHHLGFQAACYYRDLERDRSLTCAKSLRALFESGREDEAIELTRQFAEHTLRNTPLEQRMFSTWSELVHEQFKHNPDRAMGHVMAAIALSDEWKPRFSSLASKIREDLIQKGANPQTPAKFTTLCFE